MEDAVNLEPAEGETHLLRMSTALWGAVMREGPSPADDTRAALQAIRASLDAARRLRLAGAMTEEEHCRLTTHAAETAAQQERALWRWSVGRGLDPSTGQAARRAPAEKPAALSNGPLISPPP